MYNKMQNLNLEQQQLAIQQIQKFQAMQIKNQQYQTQQMQSHNSQ